MTQIIRSLENLARLYADLGVKQVYVKILAPNDNSKNQVYFGPGFKALTLFPLGDITPDSKNSIFKAAANFFWINDDLALTHAPAAQIILYPQYPEIRFSGFLKGANRTNLESVRGLMNSRVPNRVLFLGVNDISGEIIGSVFEPDSAAAKEFFEISESLGKATEIFSEFNVAFFIEKIFNPRKILLEQLGRIHNLGWINSKRLDKFGNLLACNAPQCGGYTLEAELGITPNGRSEPDFMGWEVKQHSSNVLTLMTPEPTGGTYVETGVEHFVRTYGYPDKSGKPDRLNFGGTHFCNAEHASTGLTLKLTGYDSTKNLIENNDGGISLEASDGTIAAFWAFSGILKHWNRKHRNAVYIPSEHQTSPENQYKFSNKVLLCEGTDPLLLIQGIHNKAVYYDPGIKLEGVSSDRPTVKRRSQFRVRLRDLKDLYENVVIEDVAGNN